MTCVCNHHFSRFVARELLDMIFAMGAKLTNRIQMVSRGRFFSHHAHAIVYFDSRHRVTKTRLEGVGCSHERDVRASREHRSHGSCAMCCQVLQ